MSTFVRSQKCRGLILGHVGLLVSVAIPMVTPDAHSCWAQTRTNGERGAQQRVVPHGEGLAAAYPGDKGIENHRAVIFSENFEPRKPVVIPRDRWICVEFMVRMNSSPDRADGEQAFWIDGKPAARFGPGTVKGYWMRDGYRLDAEDARAKPFEGFRWRRDMRLNVNKFWLLHYVTEGAFKRAGEYAAKHPGFRVNTKTATVWFDDIVLATEYIGPLTKP